MSGHTRIKTLDGWRGISILFVLAGHLLPLSPKSWAMNGTIASTGMSIFFLLSGFLITTLLYKDQRVTPFLVRRFLRIIPLAWLTLLITFLLIGGTQHNIVSAFLFYSNIPPIGLVGANGHFWSLCLEMQFYVAVAFIVGTTGQRGLYILPIMCVAITLLRVYYQVEMSIVSYFRADEILAGCCLALLNSTKKDKLKFSIGRLSTWVLLILLIASAHPDTGALRYFRPYIALLLIGSTIFSHQTGTLGAILNSTFLSYIARVSYALYVIHGGLTHTWLGSGDLLEKYLKRPLLFVVTFAGAHISTFYFENRFIQLGKTLTNKESSKKSSPSNHKQESKPKV